MGALWGLALAAALLAPGAARAEDLADSRLTDPEAFGRFADASRTPADAAAVRLGAAFAEARPARAAALTPRPLRNGRAPRLSTVPAPVMGAARFSAPAARAAAPKAPRRRGPSPKGLILVAAGVLLLAALRPEPAETAAPLAETWTPPPTWKREWPKTDAPAPLPPLRLPGPQTPPRPPWWGITDAERDAIARWDVSREKLYENVPLDRWLDARQAELKGVNVWRLKEKLWRDA